VRSYYYIRCNLQLIRYVCSEPSDVYQSIHQPLFICIVDEVQHVG